MMTAKQKHIAGPWGWLFWIPVWLVGGYGIWHLIKTFFLSFCSYNVLDTPSFIGLRNYMAILRDEVIGICLSNTVGIMLTAGLAVLIVGVALGLMAARLPLPCGILLGIGLGLASLSAVIPGSWGRLLSGDQYGLLNGWLGLAEPVLWSSVYGFAVQGVLLFILCLAPVYGIVYFCARQGWRRLGVMISVCVVPVLMAGGWQYGISLFGYPSANYSADWLPSIIYDYGMIRFELGMSAALQMVGLILLLLWCTVGCLSVWGIAVLRRHICRNTCGQRRSAASWVIWGLGLLLLPVMLIPLVTVVNTSLTPIEELFLSPPRWMPVAPTFQGYRDFFSMVESAWVTPEFFSWKKAMYLLFAYTTVVLPAGIGLAWFHYRGKKTATLIWLGAWSVLSLILTANSVFLTHENGFLSVVIAFFISPVYPLSLFLTAWILRRGFGKVIDGTAPFQWRRVLLTIAGIGITAFSTGLWQMYFLCPAIYNEAEKPLLQQMMRWFGAGIARSNSTCAGTVLLLLPVIIVAVLLLVLLLMIQRTDRNGAIPEPDTKIG